MKKIAPVLMMLFSALAWAGTQPNPADYTVNVHVSSSFLDTKYLGGPSFSEQRLNVVIDGKNYELRSLYSCDGVLALGDYKAKVVKNRMVRDTHTSYDTSRAYEFLFPDNKTRLFQVIGMKE